MPTAAFAPRLLPGSAVVAVAWQRSADHDDATGVGVDDNLVVGGVPVILGLLCDLVVAGGHQSAVHDKDGVLGETLSGLKREQRAKMTDDPVDCGLRDAEQRSELAHRQVRAPVCRHEQHPVLQCQAPRPSLSYRFRTLAPQRGYQPAEATRAQPGERGYPGRLGRRDHTSHTKIITS